MIRSFLIMRRGADKPRGYPSDRFRSTAIVAGSAVLALATVSPAAAAATGTVAARTQRMSDATLTSDQDGWYNPGDHLTLVCSKKGDAVRGFFSYKIPNGGLDNLWYETSDGHFVADVDVDTGSPGVAAPACAAGGPAPGKAFTTRLDDFVTGAAGRQIGDGQCVALVRKYLGDVYDIADGAWGDASAYKQGGTGGNQLESRGFSWHADRNFTNGDILVWDESGRAADLAHGHVAIWYDGRIFDQNYNGRPTAGSDPFSDYGYAGFWRRT